MKEQPGIKAGLTGFFWILATLLFGGAACLTGGLALAQINAWRYNNMTMADIGSQSIIAIVLAFGMTAMFGYLTAISAEVLSKGHNNCNVSS